MGNVTYVGVDLETSGTDVSKGAVPIELGLSLGAGLNWSSLVGWRFDTPAFTWDDESAKIHRLSKEEVFEADPASVVERNASVWLELLTGTGVGSVKPHSLVAVGWNVGSFDFPFIRRYMPGLDALFSYRFMDLNAVCFSLAEAGRRRAWQPDQAIGFEGWKKRTKAAAERTMGGKPRWHDAGYDATAGLMAWYWLCDRIQAQEGRA